MLEAISWTGSSQDLEAHMQRSIAAREERWTRATSSNRGFEQLTGHHYLLAQKYWVLGQHKESIQQNLIGSWYRRWWYRLRSLPQGQSIQLPLIGSGRVALFPAHSWRLYPGRWTGDIIRAVFLADQPTLQVLLDNQPSNSDIGQAEANMWRSLVICDPKNAEVASASLRALIDGGYGSWPSNRRLLNECNFADAIRHESQTKFEAAIVEAHNVHVAEYSGDDLGGTPLSDKASVALAMRASAMVVLGKKAGLRYAPTSKHVIDILDLLIEAVAVAPEYEPDAT